ncbi:MAG: DUF2974 domain-containing protein [Clostridia bacterium]|nr:DUF2974 domain-containing protein [Clostridia bacterium]
MHNIFDYLDWRGDLSFGSVSLCPVDALIFSLLPYIRLEGIVPPSPGAEPMRLADAAAAFLLTEEGSKLTGDRLKLLKSLQSSPRFAPLRLLAARKELDATSGMQFAAITILLPGQNLFVSFEGTDDTLIGWQEDFRMTYECPVPAQIRAAAYLREVAAAHPLRRIFVGGHSKGGNLAMYAAVHCGPEHRHRIRAVYNNDGPGFCDDTLSSPEYAEIRNRIHTYLPQSSIVAVLLEHDDNYKIVKSTAMGLLQHDPFSWQIKGADFEYTDTRTAFGQDTEAIIDRFVNELSPERKRQFCEALFTILESTEQDTVSGITGNKLQSIRKILGSYAELDPEVRTILNDSFAALNRSRKAVRKERTRRETIRSVLPSDDSEKSS